MSDLCLPPGLPTISLNTPQGDHALISLHGAQVLSWKPAGHGECLYLSRQSQYGIDCAIRGGIPVLFPQFSLRGSGQKHGFARRSPWLPEPVEPLADGQRITLHLCSDVYTRQQWAAEFSLALTVTLQHRKLHVALAIQNRGKNTFVFTGGLHTYVRVANVSQATLQGLEDCTYWDALQQLALQPASGGMLTLTGACDRVYLRAPHTLRLDTPKQQFLLQQQGFPEVVVWNPWHTGMPQFSDMETNDYQQFLCVEPAIFVEPCRLAPNAAWLGGQQLIALDTHS